MGRPFLGVPLATPPLTRSVGWGEGAETQPVPTGLPGCGLRVSSGVSLLFLT